jgi:subtilisin-like proprotein convertase family protein
MISCVEVSSTGLPKNLTDATNSGQGVTTASINVSYNLPIQDIDVMIDIEHTYLEDLDLYLETPEGTQYLLTSQLGDAENDYSNTVFDQEASESISNGSPPFTGSFRPLQSIAELYNTIPSGTWKLIVKDNYEEDTGRLVNFSLKLCLEGIPQTNSDNDSFVDEDDNCPEISNEDQADIDNNGIGDVCDIFSAQNISITKKDASCPNKANGSFGLNALADFVYRAEIIGDNGYTKNLIFTTQGNIVSNLASGNYSICVSSSSFPDFEYCFETQIKEPEPLEVISSVNTLNSIMNLSLSGSDHYYITLNEVTFELDKQDEIQLPLARKLNYIEVKTANSCQGVFEQWINTSQKASVFPNPISENASLILPENTVVDILLLSSNGTLLWENKNIQSDGNSVHIPMSRLNPGFYLLQVLYPDSVQSIKLLKR